eukprot:m.354431 g.354431  ORF g.354431 m.354431 type:complete len:164 (+) comp17019_c0_seq1:275-766(+)
MEKLNNWRRLMLNERLNDTELEDIPDPRLELNVHIGIKTAELGAVVGTVILGPLIGAIRPRAGEARFAAMWRNAKVFGLGGMVVGAVIGVVGGQRRIEALEEEGIFDRAYRLRRSRNQIRVDQAAIAASAVGLIKGPVGASLGMVSGVALGAAYNAIHQNKLD